MSVAGGAGSDYNFVVQSMSTDRSGFECWGFRGIAVGQPCRIVVVSDPAADSTRADLVQRMRADLLGAGGSPSTCVGPGFDHCWVRGEPAAANLLVYVGDSSNSPSRFAQALAADCAAQPAWELAGVLPAGAATSAQLPSAMRARNARFWWRHPGEVVRDLVDLGTRAPELRSVFVSYARADGADVVSAVADALNRANFDVFLDQYRLAAGVDFAARIDAALMDKALLVLIETDRAGASSWIRREVSTAAGRRLGLAAINVDRAAPHGLIGTSERIDVSASSFTPTLDPAVLDDVVDFVVERHQRAVVFRAQQQRTTVTCALHRAGVDPSEIIDTADGLVVTRPPGHHLVLSAPPAGVRHFRAAATNAPSGHQPVVVSPRPIGAERNLDLDWLAGHRVRHLDDALITRGARRVAGGTL